MQLFKLSFRFSKIPTWATVDPYGLSKNNPHTVRNILDGKIIHT
jgi:hypothetical protein